MERMEQLNRICLCGYVGQCNYTKVGENYIYRISVATSYAYKGEDNTPIIETTWHLVQYISTDILELPKATPVVIVGRMKYDFHVMDSGETRRCPIISASALSRLDCESLSYEADKSVAQ